MKTHAFTLIEVLITVLIIGILAAIAVPQYKKAVRKVWLNEVATTFNAITKGIDMWQLENGIPSTTVVFSGNGTRVTKLEIDQPCVKEATYYCYTKMGSWRYSCDNDGWCWMSLNTDLNADGSEGNKWLAGTSLDWVKKHDKPWALQLNTGHPPVSLRPEICRWWKGLYGSGRVVDSSARLSTGCDSY